MPRNRVHWNDDCGRRAGHRVRLTESIGEGADMVSGRRWIVVTVPGVVVLLAGCGLSPTYEADYRCEVVKLMPDGSTNVIGSDSSARAVTGEGGRFQHPGIGMIRTSVLKVDADSATIEVIYPDQSTGKLELKIAETKEHISKDAGYGVRVTLNAIRVR